MTTERHQRKASYSRAVSEYNRAGVDAAKELGISITSLNRWLSPRATADQCQKLIACVMAAQAMRAARERRSAA